MPIGKKKSKTEMKVFLCDSVRVEGEVEKAGATPTLKMSDATMLISYGKAVDADDEKAVAEAEKAIKAAEETQKTKAAS